MDALVDEAAHLPRKLGFAPKNEDIYPTDDARKAARCVLEQPESKTLFKSDSVALWLDRPKC